ncbi:MAG TPA: protein kinase [Bryobacteraceae bacterium]|jgi:serine/threonine-protein kinase
MNFEIGTTVGDYQVVDTLGAGGMGKVYKVRNLISDRIEAMKVLLPDLVTEPDLADRFLREIKVQASLEHPNIASLHTAVRVENQLLMLMEYVEGTTLEQELHAGPLPVARAVDYIRQVLSALEYAHARGVIHRDLKPANMMLTPSGIVKLMDFGIAKGATDRRLTMTGTTMGSLYYMSPEQIQGSAGLDPRSDLYSLGVSLYELVTGKRPFDGDSQYAIMAAHLEKTPVPPISVDPRLPQVLNDIILMAVMKDANSRFQTAAAFRNALGNVAAPAITAAVPGPAPAPAPAVRAVAGAPAAMAAGGPRSKRGLWMAVGAVAAALALIGIIEFGPGRGTRAAPGVASPAPSSAPAPQNPAASVPPVTDPQPVVQTPAQQQPLTAPVQTPAQQAPPYQPAAGSSGIPAKTTEQRPARQPAQQQPVQQQPVASQPVQQQPVVQQPAVQQPSVQQPPAPAPAPQHADDAAVRAALQEVREQLMMLNARATGIRGSLQRMESAQSANGLGLNASFQEPAHLMNTYLDEAANALNSGDAAAAKNYKEKAERQVERLEKLLNR